MSEPKVLWEGVAEDGTPLRWLDGVGCEKRVGYFGDQPAWWPGSRYENEAIRLMAAELARLKGGGCARDQRTTQHCAEAQAATARAEKAERALFGVFLHGVYNAANWIVEDYDDPKWPCVPHDHACMSDGEYAADLFIRLGMADPAPRGMIPRPALFEAMTDIDEKDVRGIAEAIDAAAAAHARQGGADDE